MHLSLSLSLRHALLLSPLSVHDPLASVCVCLSFNSELHSPYKWSRKEIFIHTHAHTVIILSYYKQHYDLLYILESVMS